MKKDIKLQEEVLSEITMFIQSQRKEKED